MMAQVAERHQQYLADYEALKGNVRQDGASWLAPLRERAWSQFNELGFPTATRGNELWKYTNIRRLADATFKHPLANASGRISAAELNGRVPWDDSWTSLVFIDGRYSPELSSTRSVANGVTAGNLADFASSKREVVERHLGHHAGIEDNAFAALNTAFLNDGAFVDIADDTQVQSPIQLLFVTSEEEQQRVTHPRALVLAGRGSKVTLIESYISLGGHQQFTNPVVEIVLDAGANVKHYRVLVENEKTFHIGTTRVYQAQDTSFTSISFAIGPAIGRNDLHTHLDAPGAECTLHGLYLTTNRQHLDNHISTTHSKPHGTSHQYYKGILAGNSRAVFSGKVYIAKDAQKTLADQKDLNLLLSHGAEIDTKPSLEIYADDVKAAHGATAGHVDPDTLYYMESRGLDRETARAMLIRGFALEIIEEIKPEALREYVERVTAEMLPTLQATSD